MKNNGILIIHLFSQFLINNNNDSMGFVRQIEKKKTGGAHTEKCYRASIRLEHAQ